MENNMARMLKILREGVLSINNKVLELEKRMSELEEKQKTENLVGPPGPKGDIGHKVSRSMGP